TLHICARREASAKYRGWGSMPARTKSRSTQVPAKIGRPTKYSDEWAEAFCREISQGHSVAEICGRRDQPSQQSVYSWLREDEDFLERYARARDAQADKLFKECLEIADRGSESENENPQRIQRDPEQFRFVPTRTLRLDSETLCYGPQES